MLIFSSDWSGRQPSVLPQMCSLNLPTNNTFCIQQLPVLVSDNSKLVFKASRLIGKLKPKQLFHDVRDHYLVRASRGLSGWTSFPQFTLETEQGRERE